MIVSYHGLHFGSRNDASFMVRQRQNAALYVSCERSVCHRASVRNLAGIKIHGTWRREALYHNSWFRGCTHTLLRSTSVGSVWSRKTLSAVQDRKAVVEFWVFAFGRSTIPTKEIKKISNISCLSNSQTKGGIGGLSLYGNFRWGCTFARHCHQSRQNIWGLPCCQSRKDIGTSISTLQLGFTSNKETKFRCKSICSSFMASSSLNIVSENMLLEVKNFVKMIWQYIFESDPMIWAGFLSMFLGIYLIWKFSRAKCDWRLLWKPSVPSSAFSGKIVWIVGASRGLGEALAIYFAKRGAKIILTSRSPDKLKKVKESCKKYIPESDIIILPLDITGAYSEIEAAARKSFAAFDNTGVDYVVHNAGASQHAAVEETSHIIASQLLKLNLEGPLMVTRATLPLMMEYGKGGRHVVVASMAAVVPSPGQAIYSAAKSGLRNYFASLNTELSNQNIGATVICPGPLLNEEINSESRTVFGASGFIKEGATAESNPQQFQKRSKNRVTIQEATEFIARAIYFKLDECWIARHPVLLMGYLSQYFPMVSMQILKLIGPNRVTQFREGSGSGYDIGKMLKN